MKPFYLGDIDIQKTDYYRTGRLGVNCLSGFYLSFNIKGGIYMLQFFTVPEVAKILRVKKSYVYELVYTGRINAVRFSERRIRIPEEAVKEFIEKESTKVVAN